jgi:hypothetical protein
MALHGLRSVTIGVPNMAETAAYYAEFGLSPDGDGWFKTTDGGRQLRLVSAPVRRPRRGTTRQAGRNGSISGLSRCRQVRRSGHGGSAMSSSAAPTTRRHAGSSSRAWASVSATGSGARPHSCAAQPITTTCSSRRPRPTSCTTPHGRSYLKDPAGNFSEYFSDMDCIVDDQLWTPEDLEGAAGLFLWGPPPPPSFLHPDDLAAMMTGTHSAR